ncbi:MAG: acyl-CoA dehydrogenase family protein [Alphaproteobacteria bacterium]
MPIDPTSRGQILDSVDRLVRDQIGPRAAQIDETGEFPRDLYAAAAKLGLFGLWIPEAYGGIGPDLVTPLLISERIARASPTFSLTFSNCGDATTPIVIGGTERIKRTWLPRIATGEIIPCFSLSEPQSGSDAASIRTTARRDGDSYVINGRKMWCTNGAVGGVYVCFAKTDPEAGHRGVSAFVVPRETPGLTIGRDESLIGLRGSPTTELMYDNVRVPLDARLGEEGQGFKIAMVTLDEARLNCSAMALGAARGALDCALAYAKERVQFGKPIIQHQGLAFLLARCTAALATAHAQWEKTIAMLEAGKSPLASTHAAIAKMVSTDAAMMITTEAIQVLGANGLSKAYPVERLMRDCKAFQIFDGTNQIQQMLIGRYLEKHGLPFGEAGAH